MKEKLVEQAYAIAKERYAGQGIDTDRAMESLQAISLSLHCWQTDDVTGFEKLSGALSGGIQATGNYPGKARNIDEVRMDILKAMSLIPGRHRLSLHEIYGDFGDEAVDRDQVEPRHFQSWIDWGRGHGVMLDFNSTVDDTSDDMHVFRQTIVNQDGVVYDPDYYNCFVQDLNGQIWIGTSSGLFVIEDPEDFINNDDFTYTQIKISRNDGTDYADYLFNGIDVSAIAVDAANRKWIGTSSDGIYLVSEDGQETLQHFTTENSPLISDQIQSIAVNPQTGEIMIGTFLGLVSYMSDASTPAAELDKDNVRVYPNPVRPEYNGIITVNGLTHNAEVKITTVTGQLVYSGRANGGLFTWNGCNQNGKRVSSGVYNVISTNAEGEKAVVNRITFIR